MNNREQFLQKLTALLKLAGANIKAIEAVDDDFVNVIFSDSMKIRVAVGGRNDIGVISEIVDAIIIWGC